MFNNASVYLQAEGHLFSGHPGKTSLLTHTLTKDILYIMQGTMSIVQQDLFVLNFTNDLGQAKTDLYLRSKVTCIYGLHTHSD